MTNRTIQDMPLKGSKHAPKTFKGQYYYVKEFIEDYEALLTTNNVTLDKDKVKLILRYCSYPVVEVIETLPHYTTPNWEDLKKELLSIYDSDQLDQRYKRKHLQKIYRKNRQEKMNSLSHVKAYYRTFQRVAGFLLNKDKITSKEYNLSFWKGIPKSIRPKVESILVRKDASIDLTQPQEVSKVMEALKDLFKRNRFDAEESSDSDSEDSSSNDSEDSEDSSSESDYPRGHLPTSKKSKHVPKHKKQDKKPPKKHARHEEEEESDNPPFKSHKSSSYKEPQDDMEDLIRRMQSISINDSLYATLYYRAYKLDPEISQIVPKPGFDGFRRTYRSAPTAGNIAPGARNNSPGEYVCYGCGKTGHNVRNCEEINQLIAKGTIKRDSNGRLTMGDGSPIVRARGEPFVQAIYKMAPQTSARTNFIALSSYSPDYTSDSDFESSYSDAFVMPVERAKKATKTARELRFEGVFPPPRPDWAKGKSTRMRITKEKENLPPRNLDQNHMGPAQPVGAQPVQPHGAAFDPDNDDAVMEDATPPARRRERSPRNIAQAPAPNEHRTENASLADKVRKIPVATQSELSKKIKPGQLLDKILNTQLTVTVGEALGTSREVSHSLSEVLKYKRPAEIRENLVAATIFNRNRGALIHFTLECDGRPLNALVDTGSMLNVMSKRAWQTVVRRPLDSEDIISMKDANGGERALLGVVKDVTFKCGSAVTFANVYVADHVEFDLLLGRPWQRDNRVSIEERKDGTYLIFNSPYLAGGPMELYVGSPMVQTIDDRTYGPAAVPVFYMNSERQAALYEEQLEPHGQTYQDARNIPSDAIIQVGVPRKIAFALGTGDWQGHPFDDWEVPGASLVVTERHWTYNNDIVVRKYAQEGYLQMRFFPATEREPYNSQKDSYEEINRSLTFEQLPALAAPTLETILEEPEDMQVSEDEEDEEARGEDKRKRSDEAEKEQVGVERSELEKESESIMIDSSPLDLRPAEAPQTEVDLPYLNTINPALLELPSAHLDLPTMLLSPRDFLNHAVLRYPDDDILLQLEARNDISAPEAVLEPCPVPSEAQLRSLTEVIDTFIAKVQAEEEEKGAKEYAAMQQQQAEGIQQAPRMYVDHLRESELLTLPPLRPPSPYPGSIATPTQDYPFLHDLPEAPERPQRVFPRAVTPYPHEALRVLRRAAYAPSSLSRAIASSSPPLVTPPSSPSHSRTYTPATTARSIAVPATPPNTPDDAPYTPVFSTLVVPDPDEVTQYDMQVRTLPVTYAHAFTAQYEPPPHIVVPPTTPAIPVYTIAAPVPIPLPRRTLPFLSNGHVEGDVPNVGAGRPLSPFEGSSPSTRATTPEAENASAHAAELDTDDEREDEHEREQLLTDRVSDFLAEALRPLTEELVDFIREEINEHQAVKIRKWSFRTRI